MRKIVTLICVFVCIFLTACSGNEQKNETTTLSGMVISVDGTKIEIVETSSENSGRPSGNFNGGNFSSEDFEKFNPENLEGFENFNPEDFANGNFENMPEGMPQMPNGDFSFDPENMPEGMPQRPEGSALPEGSARPDFSEQMENMEGKTVDVSNAHISVEIENGKEEGSISDITVGSFVTVTLDKDSNVTNVLVSKSSGMGGQRFNIGNAQAAPTAEN